MELADENVARLYEYVEAPGGAAIVMEAVDGVSLRALLREHGSTGPEAALAVLKGSLAGLAVAHEAGLVHRDYKPENVLVQATGTSKLVDFGIAVRAGEGGRAAGTPPYMAPEQWAGAPASPASDVYAATAVFFECLAGHRPYRSGERVVLMHQHMTAPVPVDEVPEPVRALVARGMAKRPGDRPATAVEFLAELESAAVAGYGEEWERRGRAGLAALAALLPLLFPLGAPGPVAGTTLFRTVLGTLRSRSAGVALGAAGVMLVAGGAGVYALASGGPEGPRRIDVAAAAPPAPPSPGTRSQLPPSLPAPSSATFSPPASAGPASFPDPTAGQTTASAGPASSSGPAGQSTPSTGPTAGETAAPSATGTSGGTAPPPSASPPTPPPTPTTGPSTAPPRAGVRRVEVLRARVERAGRGPGLGLGRHRERQAGTPARGLPRRPGRAEDGRAAVGGDELLAHGQVRLPPGGMRVRLERGGDRSPLRPRERRERCDPPVRRADPHPEAGADGDQDGRAHVQAHGEAHAEAGGHPPLAPRAGGDGRPPPAGHRETVGHPGRKTENRDFGPAPATGGSGSS